MFLITFSCLERTNQAKILPTNLQGRLKLFLVFFFNFSIHQTVVNKSKYKAYVNKSPSKPFHYMYNEANCAFWFGFIRLGRDSASFWTGV